MMFNRALLGKWLWHYGLEREAWWRVTMDSKFSSLWGGWCSLESARAFGVGLWKNTRKWWDKLSSFTNFEVGDGSKISFLRDQWCGEMTLKVAFLVLYGLAHEKGAPLLLTI
jgi:hypothetical protein